jgi:hypothetical protein
VELEVVSGDGRHLDESTLRDLAQKIAGLKGVRGAEVHRGTVVVRSHQDGRLPLSRLVVDQGLLPIHIHEHGLSLDEIYDRYFQEGVGVPDVAV